MAETTTRLSKQEKKHKTLSPYARKVGKKPKPVRRSTVVIDGEHDWFWSVEHAPGVISWFSYISHFLSRDEADDMLTNMTALPFTPEHSFFGNPPARDVLWLGDFTYAYAGRSRHTAKPVPEWCVKLLGQIEVAANADQQRVRTQAYAKLSNKNEDGNDEKKDEKKKWNAKVEERLEKKIVFSGILFNRYAGGEKSVDWHADAEDTLQPGAPIGGLSVGAERWFHFREKRGDKATNSIKAAVAAGLGDEPAVQQMFATLKPLLVKIKARHGSLMLMGGCMQSFYEHTVPKDSQVKGTRYNATVRMYRGQTGTDTAASMPSKK